ncbi:MAG: flavin prenyltransferase UbiX [Litorivicinus sp.]
MSDFNKTVTLAVTGASGAPYALRLMECLVRSGVRVWFMISPAARVVFGEETDLKLPPKAADLERFWSEKFQAKPGQIKVYGESQWTAPVASGSGAAVPMVVCPCSTGSLSAIAQGASNNLIERAADVALKERRPLILVPREAPYSAIVLENMLKLTQMGAVILPASPGFYHNPTSIQDLVDFVVARILGQLQMDQALVPRWGERHE